WLSRHRVRRRRRNGAFFAQFRCGGSPSGTGPRVEQATTSVYDWTRFARPRVSRMADAPVAPRKAHVRTAHGESTDDPYYWMLDRDDPDTIAYLEAENVYTAAQTEHLAPLRE